jgi:hypothetical protein
MDIAPGFTQGKVGPGESEEAWGREMLERTAGDPGGHNEGH